MPPGLTGIAQIYADRDVPRRQKFRYDRLYVGRQSFWLDVRLIAPVVLDHVPGTLGASRPARYDGRPRRAGGRRRPGGPYAAARLAGGRTSRQGPGGARPDREPVHCTGIVGSEAFQLPGVPRTAVLGEPRAVRFHSPAGLILPYVGPPGEACVIDRGVFDRSLATEAARAGAEVVTDARVVSLAVEPRGVSVQMLTPSGLRVDKATVCVLACGASYRFQRRLGWGMPSLFMVGAQAEGRVNSGDTLDVFCRADIAPTGFGWLVPINRDGELRAKVGVMTPTRPRAALGRLVEALLADGRLMGAAGPIITRLLPLGPLARTYGDRVVGVGDAAGLVKPTTGGGIYYSLLSADWAAVAVSEAFERADFSAAGLGSYEETWRAELGPELRAGVRFRRFAARLTNGDLDDLTDLALRDGVLSVVRAHARFDWHGQLLRALVRHPGIVQILLRRLAASAFRM